MDIHTGRASSRVYSSVCSLHPGIARLSLFSRTLTVLDWSTCWFYLGNIYREGLLQPCATDFSWPRIVLVDPLCTQNFSCGIAEGAEQIFIPPSTEDVWLWEVKMSSITPHPVVLFPVFGFIFLLSVSFAVSCAFVASKCCIYHSPYISSLLSNV